MTGIYLIRTGSVTLKVRSSLYEEYVIQRLYAGCSYGSYSFFAGKDSLGRRSRFTMVADSPGEYFFIPYNALRLIGQHDAQMGEIIAVNKQFIQNNGGVPWCDFKMYRGRKKMDLYLVFMQCLRRVIILNK